MKNSILVALLLIAAGAAGFLVQKNLSTPDAAPAPEAQSALTEAPSARFALSLPDLDGKQRQISDWDGESRLVNFWATWCAPCRREIPVLKQLQSEKSEKYIQVIGVAVDFPEEVIAFAEEAEFNYPVIIGQEEAMAAAESTGVAYPGLPFSILLSADGDTVKTHIGEIHAEQIERIVEVMRDLDNGSINLHAARSALQSL